MVAEQQGPDGVPATLGASFGGVLDALSRLLPQPSARGTSETWTLTLTIRRDLVLEARVAASCPDGPSTQPAPGTGPAALSRREVEVLRLIAGGSSNQSIADQLVLSVRTVERHITNLYSKIGARCKAEATAYALRHQLAQDDKG